MRTLTQTEARKVAGGKISPVQVNGGGNTPKGEANGVPTTNLNPAGSAPRGHNK